MAQPGRPLALDVAFFTALGGGLAIGAAPLGAPLTG
jgi:hypothetical protein